MGLAFMVNPHGADHATGLHDDLYTTEEQLGELRPLGVTEPVPIDDVGPRKVALFRLIQLKRIVLDSLLLCLFLPYTFEQVASITAAVTGWDTNVTEQLRVAERILTVARSYNTQEGFTADNDTLPKRFFQPKTDGSKVGPSDPAKMEQAKRYYYTLMGWDAKTGIPMPEKLEELGII